MDVSRNPAAILVYEDIMAAYDEFLAGTARGLDNAAEFLGIWVPAEDTAESILNMIVAALDWGEDALAIDMAAGTFAAMDGDSLVERARVFGTVTVDEAMGRITLRVTGLGQPISEVTAINAAYHDRVEAAARSVSHDALPDKSEGCVRVVAEDDGVELGLLVDGNSHDIRAAGFSGARTDIEKGVLEAFSRLIESTPIQDASEYGIVRLEAQLRQPGAMAPVPGVVVAHAVEPAFALPCALIRRAFELYADETGYTAGTNFHRVRPSEAWIAMGEAEKIDALGREIGACLEGVEAGAGCLSILNLENHSRVTCQFADAVPFAERGGLLMRVERHLRQALDPTIELYLVSLADKNVVRQPGYQRRENGKK